MTKQINFIANQKFINYIKSLGYEHRHVPRTRKLYFTNGKGIQVRVDLKKKNITLLDQEGWPFVSKPGFSNIELNNLLNL